MFFTFPYVRDIKIYYNLDFAYYRDTCRYTAAYTYDHKRNIPRA